MKIQIRKGVFETNSSSTHALCIGKTYNKTTNIINFGILNNHDYWTSENNIQYRIDSVFAAVISKYDYDCAKAFARFGKLINILKSANIEYSFNLDEDYIENNLPYIDEYDWVDKVLENEENFLRYIFNEDSKYITMDRDELYNMGGWSSIIDKNKVDIYA